MLRFVSFDIANLIHIVVIFNLITCGRMALRRPTAIFHDSTRSPTRTDRMSMSHSFRSHPFFKKKHHFEIYS